MSGTHEEILYLRYPHNKTELIRILQDRFALSGTSTEQIQGETDVSIVRKAVGFVPTEDVNVAAEAKIKNIIVSGVAAG